MAIWESFLRWSGAESLKTGGVCKKKCDMVAVVFVFDMVALILLLIW